MRYDEYFELSEKNSWRVSDIDWVQLASDARAGLVSPDDRGAVLGTAVIEHGVPHYAEVWSLVEGLKANWELWQFVTLWTGEEHRHSYALQKACETLGISEQLEVDLEAVSTFPFAERQKQSCPQDCLRTVPGMLTYAVIQELGTHKFYALAAKNTASPALRRLFSEIGADEMRHHVFYRDALRDGYERSDDKPWYSDRVFEATRAFQMPHSIYRLQMDFFDHRDSSIATEVVPQLARCFSFDGGLLQRLAASFAVAPAAALDDRHAA